MSDDIEFMRHAFKGEQEAINFVLLIAEVSHIWDDLIDKDKPVSDTLINRAFTISLLEIPRNKFYQQHINDLLPVMATGALNWLVANQYEQQDDKEAHALAHVLRYGIADIATLIAFLIGGHEWAEQIAPELRRRSQKDTLANYLSEVRRNKL